MNDKNKIKELKKLLNKDFVLLKQYKAFYEKTTNLPHLGLDSVIHNHFTLNKEIRKLENVNKIN